MKREDFKNLALNILLHQEVEFLELFTTNDRERYKVAQYDEDGWDIEAAMPLDEFLDDMYDAIMCEEDKR